MGTSDREEGAVMTRHKIGELTLCQLSSDCNDVPTFHLGVTKKAEVSLNIRYKYVVR
jgi:hypothetical protein